MKCSLKIVKSILVLCNLMFAASLFANPYSNYRMVDASAINKQLSKQFPIKKSFKDNAVSFIGPEIDINVLDQEVEVKIVVSSASDDKTIIGKGVFKGRLEYYAFDKTLRLREPKLDDFKVLQGQQSQEMDKIVKAIKQSMSSGFKDFVLFEFDSQGLSFPDGPAKEIEISIRKLVVRW